MWLNISLFLIDTWYKTMILNKGMTGIWIARRYWLFSTLRSQYIHQYIMYFGGGQDYFLQSFFFIANSSA